LIWLPIGSGVFCLIYSFLIFIIYKNWKKHKLVATTGISEASGVSILIPVRNEEEHIVACIASILSNDYPSDAFEILVLDDHSDDHTFSMVNNMTSEVISIHALPPGVNGKKEAISHGVQQAKFPIILCTDGDSMVGKHWVRSHASRYMDPNVSMCTGIVAVEKNHKLSGNFQFFDFAATMAITAFGLTNHQFYLCNGANFSYRKSVFNRLNGYEGNKHISSGDDLFLLHKLAAVQPDSICFIYSQDGTVVTKAEKSWEDLINQRVRWASKAMKTTDKMLALIQISVFSFVLFTWLCAFILLIHPSHSLIVALLIAIGVKMVTDYVFLRHLSKDYDRVDAMKYFLPSFFIYYAHIIFSGIIAVLAPKYIWKGRDTSH
jgi:cellulose synthase/poly-beta-1,6-N-acetylglucosamine synthase-like glycosyltransferase